MSGLCSSCGDPAMLCEACVRSTLSNSNADRIRWKERAERAEKNNDRFIHVAETAEDQRDYYHHRAVRSEAELFHCRKVLAQMRMLAADRYAVWPHNLEGFDEFLQSQGVDPGSLYPKPKEVISAATNEENETGDQPDGLLDPTLRPDQDR